MKNQVLTIEQMLELEELGIDTSIASMFWFDDGIRIPRLVPCYSQDTIGAWTDQYGEKCIIPVFTLQDILDMLPGSIEEDIIGRFDYELRIKKNGVAYESFDALDSKSEPYVFDEYYIDDEQCETVLDCAFEMLKSLKKLKKI